ncbi:hypothetical protein JN086_14210, partial [Mycolicibacterium austroafricanum]|uniref:hypothetical protein n=1 Tax=Mycolicibacterium austroafricanum TaxID=39687 RepID=UPI001ABF3FDB
MPNEGDAVLDVMPERPVWIWVLRVTADEDVGVIGVGDEWAMRAAPLGVVSGAVVVSVTGSSTR